MGIQERSDFFRINIETSYFLNVAFGSQAVIVTQTRRPSPRRQERTVKAPRYTSVFKKLRIHEEGQNSSYREQEPYEDPIWRNRAAFHLIDFERDQFNNDEDADGRGYGGYFSPLRQSG